MSLIGTVTPPGDKSISHRLVLFSLLASGEMRLTNLSAGQDVRSSLEAVEKLGVRIAELDSETVIQGAEAGLVERAEIDCGNSGTTMRLLMGLLAGRPGRWVLDGDPSLRRRPMERVAQPLRLMGARVDCPEGRCPMTIEGRPLKGIDFTLPVASAQLKSAVLLAGLQAEGATLVREPRPSRDHTERLIQAMGGRISRVEGGWKAEGSALRLPQRVRVPGDASSAAFFLGAAAITPGSRVTAEGLLLNPTRTGFLEVLARLGARVETQVQGQEPEPWGRVRVAYSPGLLACRIGPEEIPGLIDEVPILALAASQARGTTVFHDVGELRLKESDRLAALVSQLGLMGAKISLEGDKLLVSGPTRLQAPGQLDSFGDHRIAMTLRLGLALAGGGGAIRGEDSVGISYPGFHEDLERLWR